MADPFREHRFSAKEVRRILRRAAELAEIDPDTAAAERSLTREDLDRAAAEIGLPAGAVARAVEHAGEADPAAKVGEERSAFIGAPTRIVLEQEVEGEPSESDREDLLEDLRRVTGEIGAIETVGKTLIWRVNPGERGGRELSVRLRSRDGRTAIVVEERLQRQAIGLFVGLGVGGGIGPMGGYIAAIMKLGVVGLVFPLIWIPLMLLLARTIYVALAGRRRRLLEQMMRQLERSAAGWSRGAHPRARVAAGQGARVAAAGEAEAEAEAEDDEEEARARR